MGPVTRIALTLCFSSVPQATALTELENIIVMQAVILHPPAAHASYKVNLFRGCVVFMSSSITAVIQWKIKVTFAVRTSF